MTKKAKPSEPVRGKRTKYQVMIDRLMAMSPAELRRSCKELAEHQDGPMVIELLKRALSEKAPRQLEIPDDVGGSE